jgi:hypothetical protein
MKFGNQSSTVGIRFPTTLLYHFDIKIVPTKLHAKSFKQTYMDWIYGKYLRNEELEKVQAMYHKSQEGRYCMIMGPAVYPIRPEGKQHYELVGGFHRHPDSSPNM